MISIEGYSDVEHIGRGGLGDVYRATQQSTGGTVAIKVLRDMSDESAAWRRTRRELTALVSLAGHANVIQLLEVLDLPDGPAIVMEHAPGGSVADLMLRRNRPLTVGETVLVGHQAAEALAAAHARDIVHRDVKPQNLLIDAYGQIKLCDFGVASMMHSEEFQARTNAISMRYASPEDLDDDGTVGPPSDVYSLGATLLHLARGAPPTLKERLAPWVAPPTDDRELAALDAVIARCLQPEPDLRPTAAQVADDLDRIGWSMERRERALDMDAADFVVNDDDTPTVPRADDLPLPSQVTSSAPGAVDEVLASLRGEANPTADGPDTIRRPRPESALPVLPPQPAPRPRRRSVVIAVLGVVAVAGVVVGLFWPDGETSPQTRLVDRPGDLSDIRDLDWPVGAIGECLVQQVDTLEPTTCDNPHDLQRYLVGELDRSSFPDGSSFDADAVDAAVRRACDAAFEPFIGVSSDRSELQIVINTASVSSWDAGDRAFQCLVGVAGRRVVGDAEGSAR